MQRSAHRKEEQERRRKIPLPRGCAYNGLYRGMLAWISFPQLHNKDRKLIRAVKGTRDLLPPSTEVWNRVEAVARACFRAYNYHEIRTPDPRRNAVVRARRRRGNRHRHQGDVHLRGPRRHLAHAAPGEHRLGDPRLHRAPAGPAAGRAEALLHRPDVPPRAPAEGPLPPVLSRSARRPSARNRRWWMPK